MFVELENIFNRPAPFEVYTASDLWTDEHTSARMLSFHLNESVDVSSRNARFIDQSVEWIVTRFKVAPGTMIADFGCGPGLYAQRLAKRGAHVTGIDFSPRSIAYARNAAAVAGLKIDYMNQDYLTFDTDNRYDLIVMIMCDFCALSPKQRNGILNTFRRLLNPGGSVLLDVYSTSAFDGRKEGATCEENLLNGFWSPHKYYGFLNTFKYDERKVVLDKYTIVEVERVRTVYNWLQYFTPDELASEFEHCDLTVVERLGDVAGKPYDPQSEEFAVIARRQ